MKKHKEELLKLIYETELCEDEQSAFKITLREDDFAEKFYGYISNNLIESFGVDKESSYKMIKISHVPELLLQIPDLVYHYNIEYWSNDISDLFLSLLKD
jgi:hypothetical protein